MESLKQFRVSYKVTYHCWGYKGIFRREKMEGCQNCYC